jgi:Tfp pilus assembly protein PilF
MLRCGVLAASLCLASQAVGPGLASHWDEEGLSLLEQGQVSEAEKRFRRALEIDSQMLAP